MRLIVAAIVILALAANAHAIAVGSPYLEENTLKIPEGQTATYTITLQNIEDSDAQAIVSAAGIAEIIDEKESYIVPAGVTDFPIAFKITPPEDAELGDVYEVSYSVRGGKAGSLPVGLTLNRKFNVEITKNPDKFYFGTYLREKGFLWMALLITVAGYAWYKRNERKRKK
ncbi:hypothetical protein HYX10_06425 [Candidatus Woesearchaeota archaeon]|nr:hypothetical protein [Candidatus Woesearchaeota archaeon]